MIYGIITLIYIVIYTLLFTHLNVPHIVVGIMSMSSPFDPKELTMRGKHLPRPTTVRRPCPLCVNGSRSWRHSSSVRGWPGGVGCFVSRGVALRDIQTCFVTCRKWFCVAGAVLLRRSQKMRCIFRGRRSSLDVSIVILRGRRSTLDLSCGLFLRTALSGLRPVVTTCKFRGRHGILWDVLKIDGSLARNIDFEVANFEVHKKTRRKTSVLKLQSVKIGGCLARNVRLLQQLQHVSSRVSGFPVASPCLWGKLQNLSSCFKVSKQVVMSFCVAGVALPDVFTCLHFTLYTLQFSLHTPHFTLHTLHFTLRNFISTLNTSHSTLHFTLYTPHFTLYTPYFTLYTPHFTLRNFLSTLHTTLYTLYSTLYSLHSTLHTTLYTLHSTLYTLHFTLHTLHSTLYTPHSTLYNRHFTLHTLLFTIHTPHSTLSTLHFALHTLPSTLYTLHSALYALHSTLSTLHFTLHTLHFTLHTLHSTLYNALFTLHSLHSTLTLLYSPQFSLHTPHSTLHTLHSTVYTPHSTLHTLHSTVYTPHYTLYTSHSTLYTPHFPLSTLHSTHYTLHSTLDTYTLHFTLRTPHFTLRTPHFTIYTPHSTLYTFYFTFCSLHSILPTFHPTPHTVHSTLHNPLFTLYTLHSHSTLHFLHAPHFALHPLPHSSLQCTGTVTGGNRGKMYKTVQITCFTQVFYVTAFGFVGCILFYWTDCVFLLNVQLSYVCWIWYSVTCFDDMFFGCFIMFEYVSICLNKFWCQGSASWSSAFRHLGCDH